jgi:C4-dicarboxylate-specific signal transduction histidine kinase
VCKTGLTEGSSGSSPGPCAVATDLVTQAEQALESGRVPQSLELAKRAADASHRCGDQHLLGRSLLMRARAEMGTGHLLQAYEFASEAQRILGSCTDIERGLWALNLRAFVHLACGDTVRSVELFHQGLQRAVGSRHSGLRCVMLNNLALALIDNSEYPEAIERYREAAALARSFPQRQGQGLVYESTLASTHLQYADDLRRRGEQAQADAQLSAAATALPALNLQAWRSFSLLERLSLAHQVRVRAALGQHAEARRLAAVHLRLQRQSAGDLPFAAIGRSALVGLYQRTGQWQRSIRHATRTLAIWRSINEEIQSAYSLRILSELHARVGAHDRALALRKELAAQQMQGHRQAGALRCRLAAIEYAAERRHRQAEEALVHARRLAIIGRLIAQTHHALSDPIANARLLSTQALACAADTTALRPLLAELSQVIDRAASLVSQLKLFSYRSSPHPMVLSLHESLLDAWQGMDTHIGSRSADLRVSGQTQLQVWGDAQRLGIMLKVLLIELVQQAGAGGAAVVINAHIDAGEADSVLLHIEAFGGSAPPATGPASAASLGAALCMEIAAEMQGELRSARNDAAVLHYRLRLPGAETHQQALGEPMTPPAILPGHAA